jgi:putative ABC transport system permease protein
MWRAMVRDLRAHRGRLVMTLAAIVLGVAFVVSSWVVSDSTARAVGAGESRTDVDVAVRGETPAVTLTEQDRARLADLPGVTGARGVAADRAGLIGSDGKLTAAQLGTGWDGSPRFHLTAGRAPAGAGEIALDDGAATTAGLGIGDRARIVLGDGTSVRARVVGTFGYRPLGVEQAPRIAFDQASARQIFPVYQRIELSGSVSAAAVARVVGDRYDVSTRDELVAEVRTAAADAAQSTRESLLAFAAVALLAGTFVIANTFTMLVTQRTRQYALLRAVGATRRQVRRAVLGEAALLGLVGATIGVLTGIGLGLLALLAFRADGDEPVYAVSPLAVVAGFAVGVGVTVVAAYSSARRAATVAPVAALRTDATPRRGGTVVRSVFGAVLVVAGIGAVLATAGADLDLTARIVGIGGGIVAWLGVLLLAPLLAAVVLRPVARVVGRFARPALRLGVRNGVRDPRRTSATASALLVGLALVCAFATLGETIVSMFGESVRTLVPPSTTMVRSATGDGMLGQDVLDRVRDTAGVRAAADRYGRITVHHNGTTSPSTVSAIEPAAFGDLLRPEITEGSADLRRGVVVGSNEAAMLGIGVGDPVAIEFPGERPVRTRVAGLYTATEAQPLFYVDVATAPAAYRDRVTSVYATGADPAAVRSALDAVFADRPDVVVTDRDELVSEEAENFASVLGVMYAMFGAAIVVAVFGVVNTLALSVLERTREIGVLRALGAGRRFVRRAIRLESIVICGYGGLLGIVVGVGFGAVLQHAMLGRPLWQIGVPYAVIGVSLAGMVLVGVAAALWPARRASRVDVLTAIAEA